MTATADRSNVRAIEMAAAQLRNAHDAGCACAPVRMLLPDADVEAAYAVQQVNTRQWIASGRRLIGRKIGLTSRAVQRQLGVDQPDYDMLFADMEVADGAEVSLVRVLQPKVEAEIALVLERDLTREHLTLVDLINAVAYALQRSRLSAAVLRTGTSASSIRSPTTRRQVCTCSAAVHARYVVWTCACVA